jgi:hypothetical protein
MESKMPISFIEVILGRQWKSPKSSEGFVALGNFSDYYRYDVLFHNIMCRVFSVAWTILMEDGPEFVW